MKLFVLDGHEVPNSEDMAMLQALYSRSDESVESHLEKVKAVGSGKFMGSYYLGYGHSSIGECGETVMFFENVSMLAAKAIQNFTLYQGQECSTRYLDFSKRDLISPIPEMEGLQRAWVDFYAKTQPRVQALLEELHTRDEDVPLAQWQRAIKARSFDICRCFLPVGCTTQLSWKSDLRKARERLLELKVHPCAEVRELASTTLVQLTLKYPNSFKQEDWTPVWDGSPCPCGEISFKQEFYDVYHEDIFAPPVLFAFIEGNSFESEYVHGSNMLRFNPRARQFLEDRPEKEQVPKSFERFGGFYFGFMLDYGSWRDLARHRSAQIPMPVVGQYSAFEPWYLDAIDELSPELGQECRDFVTQQFQKLDFCRRAVDVTEAELQYYYPLGTRVHVSMYASLPSAIYIAELRTSQFVHPTMRSIALKMADALRYKFPAIKLYVDWSPTSFHPGRGNQTITEKEKK